MAHVLKCNRFGITLINSNSFNSIQFKNCIIDYLGMAMGFRKSKLRWDSGGNKLHFYNIVKSTSRMEPYLDLLFIKDRVKFTILRVSFHSLQIRKTY